MELIGSTGKASIFRDNIRSVFGLKSTKFDIVTESSNNSGQVVLKDGSGVKHQVDDLDSLMVIDGQNNLVDLKNSQGMRQVITKSGKSDLTSDMNKVTSGIVFIGQGNGHGLGMSQWGARGMAQKGSTYQEIIEHYYNQDKYDGSIIIEKH